jgi:4-hydroxy-tetrahydrodipicolinate reductase
MAINVFVAGGTGWAGSELCKGLVASSIMTLTGALSRKNSGENLADILSLPTSHIPIFSTMDDAIKNVQFDVLVEYTKPNVAKANIVTALKHGKRVVVGTSGLTDDDYTEIESVALEYNTSVLAVGNFALTVVLLQKFSQMAAKYIPDFEIIDYAHESKVDAPSGTARELAFRLSHVRESTVHVASDDIVGYKESRGARLKGVQVHSVRLPGHVISIETIFGLKDERLTLRHDSGSSAAPYVQGALLAIEKVGTFKGLKRGLDSVMDF